MELQVALAFMQLLNYRCDPCMELQVALAFDLCNFRIIDVIHVCVIFRTTNQLMARLNEQRLHGGRRTKGNHPLLKWKFFTTHAGCFFTGPAQKSYKYGTGPTQ